MNKKATLPISFMCHEISKLYINKIKSKSEMLGINPTFYYIFMLLNKNPQGISQKDICEKTNLKAPSISLVLQNMENDGLIIRIKDENDNRVTLVKITPKGEELNKKIKAIFSEVDASIDSLFTKEDGNKLRSYLNTIKIALKEDN